MAPTHDQQDNTSVLVVEAILLALAVVVGLSYLFKSFVPTKSAPSAGGAIATNTVNANLLLGATTSTSTRPY